MQINPYLNFNGQCEEAFTFYAECLGGKIEAMMPFAGTPAAEYAPAGYENKIMHARLSVGDAVLMGSDAPSENYEAPQGTFVSLNVASADDADRIFGSLSDGGNVIMPIDKTFWAERFGMVTDRFGTPWMINCDQQQNG